MLSTHDTSMLWRFVSFSTSGHRATPECNGQCGSISGVWSEASDNPDLAVYFVQVIIAKVVGATVTEELTDVQSV